MQRNIFDYHFDNFGISELFLDFHAIPIFVIVVCFFCSRLHESYNSVLNNNPEIQCLV